MNTRKLFVVAVGLAGTLCAGAAMAHERADVQWSVTIGAPAYEAPAVVYGQPAYVAPAPVIGYGRPVVVERHYRRPTRWDVDGDGIPNRYDRVYNPRWDRDGDGIPNRRDPHPYRYDGNRGWHR